VPPSERAKNEVRAAAPPAAPPLLRISDLSIGYVSTDRREPIRLIRDVDLTVERNEIVGLVGESGSGKTQTARAILRLNSKPLAPLSGRIMLDGIDLLALPESSMRDIRGGKVAMIFQDPRSSLNPLMRIGDQLARVYALHKGMPYRAAYAEAIAMLRHAGIAGPDRVAQSYPHQLSGGMCQRVMISIALGIRPHLLIADEPTTGLDVTIQAQILELIKAMQTETGASLLLITHDLGVVAEVCRRVAVMYAGRVVEIAPVTDLFAHPRHPYTIHLLTSTLSPDGPRPVNYGSAGVSPAPGASTSGHDACAPVTRPWRHHAQILPEGRGRRVLHTPDVAGAAFTGTVDFTIGRRTYRAALDAEDAPGLKSTLIEVAPGHLVLCRRLERDRDRCPVARSGQTQGSLP
jgi:ABC-type dipeptide/oligopeptide/nickel transport system ATPase component